jgi:hypothetical protein
VRATTCENIGIVLLRVFRVTNTNTNTNTNNITSTNRIASAAKSARLGEREGRGKGGLLSTEVKALLESGSRNH